MEIGEKVMDENLNQRLFKNGERRIRIARINLCVPGKQDSPDLLLHGGGILPSRSH